MIYEKIKTTLPKAKETRALAEKVITLAKDNSLKNKRMVYDILQDHKLTATVFSEIAPRFKKRAGGYTRIISLEERRGDGAQLALLSLVELRAKVSTKAKKSKKETKESEVKEKPEVQIEAPKAKETKGIKEKPKGTKEDIKKVSKEAPKEEKKKGGFLKNLRNYLKKSKRPETD